MASAVTFCAVPSSQLPTTWTTSQSPPEASSTSWMPIERSRSTELPGRPRTSRILPPVLPCGLQLVDQELRPLAAHLELVLVDLHHRVGVEHVVEGHEHHVLAVGEADHPVEAVGRDGDGDDRVEALVDEVLDGAELRRRVGAGRDDLELGDLVLDRRVLGVGLGGLDHLDAPGVADEAVDDGDPVGALLGRPLQVGGFGAPGREAGRVGARAGRPLGPGQGHRAAHASSASAEPSRSVVFIVFLPRKVPLRGTVCAGRASWRRLPDPFGAASVRREALEVRTRGGRCSRYW